MATKIISVKGNERLSSQELLQQIYVAMQNGETEFDIEACGQHDIGGPLWNEGGHPLKFTVTNPGQRLGSMGMKGTTIVVEGTASADTGWLNAGAEIVVKGDSGDTTSHCAAGGKIYVGGRVGTRSGSLMKHDPAYDAPEFWVLKNTGSFSFEFMGGGTAVVCGVDTEQFESVLGDRACTGMVRGTVYFRGTAKNISTETTHILPLDENDKAFLTKGIPEFLNKVGQKTHEKSLLDFSQWQKVTAKTFEELKKVTPLPTIKKYKESGWVQGGLFGDIYEDDGRVVSLVNRGEDRIREPQWLNAQYAAPCEAGCPTAIPTQQRFNLLREGREEEAYRLILEYTPFPGSVCGGVCPNPCMDACSRCVVDTPANIGALGRLSSHIAVNIDVKPTGKKVAIVGAGVAGLSAAWILRLRGHEVTVFERDKEIGGKLFHAVSRQRLKTEVIEAEIERIKNSGIIFKNGVEVDKSKLDAIKNEYQAVILAIGAYTPKLPPWPGKERLLPYLEFLKQINSGKKPTIGKKVVVIGCGNSGMDVVFGAYEAGATEVTALDVQKPAAFEVEIEHAKKLGAKLVWPVFTKEITEKGVVLSDGTLIEADTVIAAIGDGPELEKIVPGKEQTRGYLNVGQHYKLEDNVWAVGDMTRLGILTAAIGAGREAALAIHEELGGRKYAAFPKVRIPKEKLSLGYFSAVDTTDYGKNPEKDFERCISCGTCRDCEMCLNSCPEKAITRVTDEDTKTFEYVSAPDVCIGCGVCEGVCPCGIWTMA